MRSGTLENIGGALQGCCCLRPPRALYISVDKIFLSYGVCTRTGVNWRESGRDWRELEKTVLFFSFQLVKGLEGQGKRKQYLCGIPVPKNDIFKNVFTLNVTILNT